MRYVYDKVRTIALWAFRLYYYRVFIGKSVFVFSGVRRSGNHACIAWMANVMTGKEVDLEKKSGYYLDKSGELILLNEINFRGKISCLSLIKVATPDIKRASIVFLSLEDYVPSESDFYVPNNSTVIKITRSVLSTIASRITYNIKRAKDGIDRGDMGIDPLFFSHVRLLQKNDANNACLWSYDLWLNEKSWRIEFLNSLNLKEDTALTSVSDFGGGSSFVGQDLEALRSVTDRQRWEAIDWPKRVVSMLEKNRDLLNAEEQAFLASLSCRFIGF